MPVFPSLGAFGQTIDRMERGLALKEAGIMLAAGKEAQALAERAASADLGGDPKFSGWAPTLDTKLRVIGTDSVMMTPTRSSAGPWTVAEFGRNQREGPRLTGPRLTRTGRVSKAKQKRWNGRTEAKHTATDAHKAISLVVPKVVDQGLRSVIRQYFDMR